MPLFKRSKQPKTKSEIDYLTIGYYIRNSKQRSGPVWLRPFEWTERRLEAFAAWLQSLAFLEILGIVGNLSIIVAVSTFVANQDVRHDQDVIAAWQTITSAAGQSGNGGRKEAIEFLVSQPWRFPWPLCREGSDWPSCVVRQPKQSLAGLDVGHEIGPGVYLLRLNVPNGDLRAANLRHADLSEANLQQTVLVGANLQQATLWKTNLQQADLAKAHLPEAVLREANLQQADLTGTNLQQVDLREANLAGATYTDAESGCPFSSQVSCPTKFPDGFDPEAAGMILWTPESSSGD